MKKSFNITFSALLTALICILSQISFATPSVPVTLQILGVALCGFVLPVKWALGCIVTYISVGALGLPVFSAFQGGIQAILGPTGGFILGFTLLTLCCSLSKKCKNTLLKFSLPFLGLALCHTIGILQYSIISGNPILPSLLTASLPFLLKDIILILSAFFLSEFLENRLKKFNG